MIDIYLPSHFHFSIFPFSFFCFQCNIGSKCASLASVVTLGYPIKKPYSDVACNISKAFKCASSAGRKTNGDRNAASEKEGELFVQVLCPDHSFADGIPFTNLYINVVQYIGGMVVPVWNCNNNLFTAALIEVLKSTKDVDLVSEWLNYAMKFMVDTETL
jgi:hypothetical protein